VILDRPEGIHERDQSRTTCHCAREHQLSKQLVTVLGKRSALMRGTERHQAGETRLPTVSVNFHQLDRGPPRHQTTPRMADERNRQRQATQLLLDDDGKFTGVDRDPRERVMRPRDQQQ
jgi:hypothetical protein